MSDVEAQEDLRIVEAALGGDAEALEALVRRHQAWLHAVACRLVVNPADAEDLAQDVLIRVVTRLSTFKGQASFRTWVYRILKNRFLDLKKRPLEQAIQGFDSYGAELDGLPDQVLTDPGPGPDRALLVEEAKVGCMLGMLLCLDREQRLTYVLGEIFGVPSPAAAEILEIAPATFRKRLERARRDLTAFMNDKCGLVNTDNPCRCEKKTRAFMDQGWVDPTQWKFTGARLDRLRVLAPERSDVLCTLTQATYADLFRDHPVRPAPDYAARLARMLEDPDVRATFELDPPLQ